MGCEISIGDYLFKHCNSFNIKRSWKNITQTATIKLHNIEGLLDKIKVGDDVEIKAAYDGDFKTEFIGCVSSIKPTIPVEINCECLMWKLKQKEVSNSWKSTTLEIVLKYLVPDAEIECPLVSLSPFRLDKITIAKALQRLKDEYLLSVYYRERKLFVGLPYTEKLPSINYEFRTKYANANIHNLVYKNKEDVKIKVKAISVFPNNTKIEKVFGDEDGDSTTLHYYNKKESEIEILAKEQLERLKYDGYKGTFKTKGLPFIDHGYLANIYDEKYPDRSMGVYVDSVELEYGPDGFNRYVEAGKKNLNV